MEKKNFISLIMGTVGGILFAIGMCMCLLPQWNAFNQGVVISLIGLVILLIMLLVRRKLEGKPVIVKLSARTVGTVLLGIIGALVLGIGMCCTMEWAGRWFVPGIIIGVIGIVMIALAYPLYERITKKERKKIAPLILKLADELKSKE